MRDDSVLLLAIDVQIVRGRDGDAGQRAPHVCGLVRERLHGLERETPEKDACVFVRRVECAHELRSGLRGIAA